MQKPVASAEKAHDVQDQSPASGVSEVVAPEDAELVNLDFGDTLCREEEEELDVNVGESSVADSSEHQHKTGAQDEELDLDFGERLVVEALEERHKIGLILLNIGTPASTSTEDVREYLSKFLADDRVIEIQPPILKAAILKLLLTVRPASSAENYKKIWDPVRGSPLLFHSEDLASALQKELGDSFDVRIGMQYSEPTVQQTMKQITKDDAVDDILLCPMFPHYASGTTGSCLEGAYKAASEMYCTPYLSVLPPFFGHPAYITAMRDNITKVIGEKGKDVDHMIFSFHGLPETQCSRTDETSSYCLKTPGCCSQIKKSNRNCYRAQCYETARLLAYELNLDDNFWSIGFQSRLTLRGTIQWIRPYTDELFEDLAAKGVRKLAVVAPSFTSDCVETLEELGLTGQEQFEAAGGEELVVVPCLNSSEEWIRSFGQIVREHLQGRARVRTGQEAVAAPPLSRSIEQQAKNYVSNGKKAKATNNTTKVEKVEI